VGNVDAANKFHQSLLVAHLISAIHPFLAIDSGANAINISGLLV